MASYAPPPSGTRTPRPVPVTNPPSRQLLGNMTPPSGINPRHPGLGLPGINPRHPGLGMPGGMQGTRNPYRTGQQAITPDLLAAMARRRLGG